MSQNAKISSPTLLQEGLRVGQNTVKTLSQLVDLPKSELVIIAIHNNRNLVVTLSDFPDEIRAGIRNYTAKLSREMDSISSAINNTGGAQL